MYEKGEGKGCPVRCQQRIQIGVGGSATTAACGDRTGPAAAAYVDEQRGGCARPRSDCYRVCSDGQQQIAGGQSVALARLQAAGARQEGVRGVQAGARGGKLAVYVCKGAGLCMVVNQTRRFCKFRGDMLGTMGREGTRSTIGWAGIWAIERSSQVPSHGPCQEPLI